MYGCFEDGPATLCRGTVLVGVTPYNSHVVVVVVVDISLLLLLLLLLSDIPLVSCVKVEPTLKLYFEIW